MLLCLFVASDEEFYQMMSIAVENDIRHAGSGRNELNWPLIAKEAIQNLQPRCFPQ